MKLLLLKLSLLLLIALIAMPGWWWWCETDNKRAETEVGCNKAEHSFV